MADYTPEGADVIDEAVACTTEEVISGETYYTGRVEQHANEDVEGNEHPDYGIWTAASQGGTRIEVILEGLPGAGQIAWDIETGRLISPSSQTVYCSYRGYGSFITDAYIEAAVQSNGIHRGTLVGGAEVRAYSGAPNLILEIVREGSGDADVTLSHFTLFAGFSSAATGNSVLQVSNRENPGSGGATNATLTLTNSGAGAYWATATQSMTFTQASGQGRLFARFTTANNHANFTLTARA